jgi:hypothetical protein
MSSDEIQLRELETMRCKAMIAADTATLERMMADDLVYTHTSGRIDSKASFIGSLASGALKYRRIEQHDVQQLLLDNVIIFTGRTEMEVVVGGEAKLLRSRFSNVWAKRSGKWQQLLWHATLVRDPAR